MRALHFDGKLVRYRTDLPQPVPGEGEVRVRILTVGICQTDLEIARGYMAFTGILGHEFVGVVEQAGPGAGGAGWIGKRVCGEINCICGKCAMCSRGLSSHCVARTVIGIQRHDGAFAEHLCLPIRNLHAVPDHVSDEEAVFVEPLAAAFQILRQVPMEKRTRALVLGDGRLGQLAAQVLARTGCQLTLAGRHEEKLALAEKLSALRGKAASFRTMLERDLRGGRDHDVVVDCTGRAEGFQRALTLVRPRGVVVLKTTVAEPAPLQLAPVVIDEITVIGSRCGPFPEAINALAAREVSGVPLVTRRVGLEQAAEMFAPGAMRGMIKVLIRVSPPATRTAETRP